MRRAADRGIEVLAVTDHDTLAALGSAQRAAHAAGITLVQGVELSVTVDGTEVHLLGYGFDPTHAGLQEHCTAFMEARATRMQHMVDQLRNVGVKITEADVRAEAESAQAYGRPHVAAALVTRGVVATAKEAFDRYLTPDTPGYVPKPEVPAREVLDLVHEAGGIGVLAHPGHWTSSRHVVALIRAGLDGIEVVHPSHDNHLEDYYRRLAARNDLVATGGSDDHGRARDDTRLGRIGLSQTAWERIEPVLT